MCASDQLAETFGSSNGLSSLGHISESRDGRLLEVEFVGFDRQKFNQEIQQIKQTIFETAVEEGASHEEALVEVKENLPLADAVIEIDQQIKKDQSLEGTFDVTALKAASGITPETATLLLQRF